MRTKVFWFFFSKKNGLLFLLARLGYGSTIKAAGIRAHARHTGPFGATLGDVYSDLLMQQASYRRVSLYVDNDIHWGVKPR